MQTASPARSSTDGSNLYGRRTDTVRIRVVRNGAVRVIGPELEVGRRTRNHAEDLGGWKTLSKVLRDSHLAPSHLQAAVARLVPSNDVELARN